MYVALEHAPKAPHADSRSFAADLLGPLATRRLRGAVMNAAPDRGAAIALVMMSPEFQRR
jgi:uncharacterized protein (DUF1800 family)